MSFIIVAGLGQRCPETVCGSFGTGTHRKKTYITSVLFISESERYFILKNDPSLSYICLSLLMQVKALFSAM